MSESVPPKQRVRVTAKSSASQPQFTSDTFQNFLSGVGINTNNMSTGSTYGFNPITRNHVLLEWMYRGSWLVKKVVDVVAEDMTRAGISFASDLPPTDESKMYQYLNQMQIWTRLTSTLKWSRLYGGAAAVIVIDGQNPATPLNVDTIKKGQFKGLLPLDRWMLWPSYNEPVTEFGVDFGLPEYYDITADARTLPRWRIHHTRLIRIDGIELPYWQKIAENGWGLSVIEPMFDRQVAFDSATLGAGQLVYKAHLRVVRVQDLRNVIAGGAGSLGYQSLLQYWGMIRLLQSNEGLTVLDKEDEFQTYSYSFAGISDILIQLGQQISGAVDIPLVRLFGQSPAGLSATGESDIRNYYDYINAQQVARLYQPILKVMDIAHRSLFGKAVPDGFDISFNPLWQLTPEQKAGIAKTTLDTVDLAKQGGLIDTATAQKELRQSSKLTGIFTNITDEMIKETEANPPEEMENEMQQMQLEGMKQAVLQPSEGDRAGAQSRTTPERESREAGYDKQTVFDFTTLPVHEVQGIRVYIDTKQGEQRLGYGWAVNMPCDYGYISGTSSAEGPQEQMDCFVGADPDSVMVWVIDQVEPDTGVFDEHKVFLGFTSRDDVLATYKAAFSDAKGAERIGTVRSMNVDAFKQWLTGYKYGEMATV